jgi:hypothetical protein
MFPLQRCTHVWTTLQFSAARDRPPHVDIHTMEMKMVVEIIIWEYLASDTCRPKIYTDVISRGSALAPFSSSRPVLPTR